MMLVMIKTHDAGDDEEVDVNHDDDDGDGHHETKRSLKTSCEFFTLLGWETTSFASF